MARNMLFQSIINQRINMTAIEWNTDFYIDGFPQIAVP